MFTVNNRYTYIGCNFYGCNKTFFYFNCGLFYVLGLWGGFFLYTHISMLLHGVRLDAQFFYYLHFQFSLWESLTTIMDAYDYYSCQFLSAQLINIDGPGQLLVYISSAWL